MADPAETTGRPTGAQIAQFVEVFTALDSYEAMMFDSRGWGAFDRSKIQTPDPDVVAVITWLKGQAA